jgi:hypothetical protein
MKLLAQLRRVVRGERVILEQLDPMLAGDAAMVLAIALRSVERAAVRLQQRRANEQAGGMPI